MLELKINFRELYIMEILKKVFIKDYKNISNPKVRHRYGVVAGTFGIISNIILFIIKLLIGLLSGSITIVVDAVNNLTDAGSSILTLIGFKLSSKPADKEHPFGHARIENITGLIISLIIFAVGILFAKSCIEKIITPQLLIINTITYVILGVAILIKLIQMLVYFNFSKATHSETLKASGIDARNDIVTTTTVLISMIIMNVFSINIDGYIGLVVSIFIIISAITMIKNTISPLISEKPQKELVNKVVKEILKNKEIINVHDLIIHSYGNGISFVSIHIEVSANMSLLESHELVDQLVRYFLEEHGISLTIQVDPIDKENPKTNEIYHKVKKTIKDINKKLSIHSLRVIYYNTHTKVLFDITEDFKMSYTKEEINNALQLVFNDGNYEFVFTIEKPFI